MIILLLISFSVCCIILGKFIFGRWYNHVSIYSFIWGTTLSLFEIRLINYYPLEIETWIVIFSGWLAFILGSFTISAIYGLGGEKLHSNLDNHVVTFYFNGRQIKVLRNIVLFFSLLALFEAVYYWLNLIKTFGSITNVLIFGNLVYSMRTAGVIQGGIPYLGALALAGTCFAGIYTALIRRFSLIAIFPILVIVISSVASMGRAAILIALILFLSGYFFTKYGSGDKLQKNKKFNLRQSLSFVVILVIVLIGMEIVRSHRGTFESLPGATQLLNKLSGSSFITPSIYLYLTVDYGVLNQYLKRDEEKVPLGTHTFAPIWRFLSKFGFDTYVPEYQKSYFTPVGSNTATYLREVHADFGLLGIYLYPYILGLLTSFFWYRSRKGVLLVTIVVLSHLYVIIGMSFVVNATRLGYWMVSFLSSLVVAVFLNSKFKTPIPNQ